MKRQFQGEFLRKYHVGWTKMGQKKGNKRKVWVACNLYCVLLPYFCLSGWKAVIFWLIRWTEHFPRIAHLWIHPGVLQRLDCGWPHHRHICRHVVSHPIWHEGRHLENVGNKRSTPHFLVKKIDILAHQRRFNPFVLPPTSLLSYLSLLYIHRFPSLTSLWTSLNVFFGLAQRDWKCHLITA